MRNLWLLKWRWWYLSVLCGSAILLSLAAMPSTSSAYRVFLAAICGTGLLINLGLSVIGNSRNLPVQGYHALAVTQIVLDATLAALVIYFLGGPESRATILFAIPILSTGILFVPIFAYFAAGLCSLLYAAALMVQDSVHPVSYQPEGIASPIVLYSLVFFLLAIIVSGYTRRTNAKERETSYAELLSLLRHQLHHPSGVIAAIVEMIEKGDTFAKLTPKERDYIKQLKYENHRIHSMITNLLKTAQLKKDVEHWTEIHLTNLINECATSVAMSFKRMDDLRDNLPNDDIIILGNAEQLQTAFENIIENAFRYSKPGKTVGIQFKTGTSPVIEIDIEDHGEGIEDSEQRKLFKAFSELDKPTSDGESAINSYSMGLGLYISKLIIEQHGGEMSLESKVGQGTKVIIHLKRDMWRKLYGQK